MTYSTYKGTRRPDNELAILHAGRFILIAAIDGRTVKEIEDAQPLLERIRPGGYGLLPGKHKIEVFYYYGGAYSGPGTVITSYRAKRNRICVLDAKAGYTYTIEGWGNRDTWGFWVEEKNRLSNN